MKLTDKKNFMLILLLRQHLLSLRGNEILKFVFVGETTFYEVLPLYKFNSELHDYSFMFEVEAYGSVQVFRFYLSDLVNVKQISFYESFFNHLPSVTHHGI
jgi:hypothetical protein